MQSFTNKDKKIKNNIVSLEHQPLQKKKKKKKSLTKTYFCYFIITFEMSLKIMFLVFGVLNTKYLPFRTFNATTLILG